jgi:hypothetical protein
VAEQSADYRPTAVRFRVVPPNTRTPARCEASLPTKPWRVQFSSSAPISSPTDFGPAPSKRAVSGSTPLEDSISRPTDGTRFPESFTESSILSRDANADLKGTGIPGSLKTSCFPVRSRGSAPSRNDAIRQTSFTQNESLLGSSPSCGTNLPR